MSSRPSRGAARLAAILDALPDALLLVNRNGTVVNANAVALEALEAPGTPIVGRGVLDLLPTFDHSRIPGSVRVEDPAGSRTRPTRMTARRTDGTTLPVEVTSANLSRGYDDELLMIVVRDLRGSLDVEAELSRQQRQTEMILRAASEGIIGIDADGSIVLVNPAAARILRLRAGDLGGKSLHAFLMPRRANGEPLPPEECPPLQTLAGGKRQRARDQALWRGDEDFVRVDMTTAPILLGETVVGAVMTFTDTARERALAARREQLADLLRGELVDRLDGARARLRGLADGGAGELGHAARRQLRQVAGELESLSELAAEVLDHQRSSTAEPEKAPTTTDDVVAGAIETMTYLARGADVTLDVAAAQPVGVRVDVGAMTRAVAHLIADMVAPGAKGSAVTVDARQDGDVARIEVRGTSPRNSNVHLPLARAIVEAHGGRLITRGPEASGPEASGPGAVPAGKPDESAGQSEGAENAGKPGDATPPAGAAGAPAKDAPGAGTANARAATGDGEATGDGKATADGKPSGDGRPSADGPAASEKASAGEAPAGGTDKATGKATGKAADEPAGKAADEAADGPGPGRGGDEAPAKGAGDEDAAPAEHAYVIELPVDEEAAKQTAEEAQEAERTRGRTRKRARTLTGLRAVTAPSGAKPEQAAAAGGPEDGDAGDGDAAAASGEDTATAENEATPAAETGDSATAADGTPGGTSGGATAAGPGTGRPAGEADAADGGDGDGDGEDPDAGADAKGGDADRKTSAGTPTAGAAGGPETPGTDAGGGLVPVQASGAPGAVALPAVRAPGGAAQPVRETGGADAQPAAAGPARLRPAAGPVPAVPLVPPPPPAPAQARPAEAPVPQAVRDAREETTAAREAAGPMALPSGASAPSGAAAALPAAPTPAPPQAAPPAAEPPERPSAGLAPAPRGDRNRRPLATPPAAIPAQARADEASARGTSVQEQTPPGGTAVPSQGPIALPSAHTVPGDAPTAVMPPVPASGPPPGPGHPGFGPAQQAEAPGPYALGPGAGSPAPGHPAGVPGGPVGVFPVQPPQAWPGQPETGPYAAAYGVPQASHPDHVSPGQPHTGHPHSGHHQVPHHAPQPGGHHPGAHHAGQPPVPGPAQQTSQPAQHTAQQMPQAVAPHLAQYQAHPGYPGHPGHAPHPGQGMPQQSQHRPYGPDYDPDYDTPPPGSLAALTDHEPPQMVAPTADGQPRRLLVWPEPDAATAHALTARGWHPVLVRTREHVEANAHTQPAALFVDPLTGPITRTALQSLRLAATAVHVPVLVTAGLMQATRDAAFGADPAVLLRSLAPADSAAHASRVLLVEANPDIAGAFTGSLQRRGMDVVHASSESEAVSKASSVEPNLVVLDLMLVRRRRVGVVDWLRNHQRLHTTPIVVYTTVDIADHELHRLQTGETVLFLAERSTREDVQQRIVDLLGKIAQPSHHLLR